MQQRFIVLTYKDGTQVNIDVPELYYQNKYKNKANKKLHKIFLKDYNSLVSAVNNHKGIIKVNKYLPFSNVAISTNDILSVDVKYIDVDEYVPLTDSVYSPEICNKSVSDVVVIESISDDVINGVINKLMDTDTMKNINSLVESLMKFINKSNVEFTLKKTKSNNSSNGSKKTTSNKKLLLESTSKLDVTHSDDSM